MTRISVFSIIIIIAGGISKIGVCVQKMSSESHAISILV
jgi:hypothetical protein